MSSGLAKSWEPISYDSHSHEPTLVLTGDNDKGKWGLYVGSRWKCVKEIDGFDAVVNLTGDPAGGKVWGGQDRLLVPPKFPVLQKYIQPYKDAPNEIVIDWPNYGVANLPFEFWEDLYVEVITQLPRTLMFCLGGHGRTGTALAMMLVASGAVGTAKEAVSWVRKNYCHKAVENRVQEDMVQKFETWLKT